MNTQITKGDVVKNSNQLHGKEPLEGRTIKFSDICILWIDDIFPNPTDEQKKIWEKVTEEHGEFHGWIDNYYNECIKELRKVIYE